jgi:hypothetical protein
MLIPQLNLLKSFNVGNFPLLIISISNIGLIILMFSIHHAYRIHEQVFKCQVVINDILFFARDQCEQDREYGQDSYKILIIHAIIVSAGTIHTSENVLITSN